MTGSSMGMYVRGTRVNTNFEFSEEWPDSVWSSRRDLSFEKGSNDMLEKEWVLKRPEPLLEKEANIYWMADSVQSMTQYKLIKGLLYGLGTGNVKLGKIELGPWYYAYSNNPIEGNRFRLGVDNKQ